MPITPFLSGEPFLPETLQNMSTAFEAACKKLGLVVKHDPATELVAKFMVELAQTGVHDYERQRWCDLATVMAQHRKRLAHRARRF